MIKIVFLTTFDNCTQRVKNRIDQYCGIGVINCNGIYFLKVTTEKGIKVEKIIKE